MKNKHLKIFLISLLLSGCNSDKDILATYKDGTVTRKDLRSYYKIYGMDENPQSKTLEYQNSVIKEIAVQNIVFDKFKEIPEEEFKTILDLTKKQFQVSLFRKDYMEKAEKDGKMEFADVQLVVVKDAEKSKERISKIMAELNQLKSDDKITAYIALNTDEDTRKSVGGILEPVCLNCGDDPLKNMFEEGLTKKDHKFYLLVNGPNAFIYRITQTIKIDLDETEKFMKSKFKDMNSTAKGYLKTHTDEKAKQDASYYGSEQFIESAQATADHYKKKHIAGLWNDKMTELKTRSGLVLNENVMKEQNLNDQSLLFTDKSGKPFTLGDLGAEYNKLASLSGNLSREQLLKDKLGFFYQLYLPYLIISSAENFAKITESDIYKEGIDILKKSIIWKYKQRKLVSQNIPVTEKEMLDTYNAGKMYAYSSPNPADPTQRTPMPYAAVRERIKGELDQSKKTKILQDFIQSIEKDYQIAINTKELKAGKL